LPTESPSAITGRVLSNGQAIDQARVRFQTSTDFVLTDTDGRFRLPLDQLIGAKSGAWVTAAKPGYIIAGKPAADGMVIELKPLPENDDEHYAWIDPTPDENKSLNCGNCHPAIYDQWQFGGHARSATNRHFLNLYDGGTWDGAKRHGWSLLDEYPEGAGVCAACHAPSAPLDTLGVSDIRKLTGVDQKGVHCDFCHKVQDMNLAAIGLTHGRFAMNLLRPAEGQVFFGPLDDVDRGEDSFLPLLSESHFCAACHEGTVFGVPVYTTYSEWLSSRARAEGKECQSCHMRPNGRMTNFAPAAGGLQRDPATLASHTLLPGGADGMLRRSLDVTPSCQIDEHQQTIRLSVRLSAHDVGHHVPTGFIDRHMLLVVELSDIDGRPLEPLAGPRLPEWVGEEGNRPGALFAKRLVDAEGRSPVPFWRAGTSIVDTRLDPAAPRTIEFALSPSTAEVRIRLLHRRFWQSTAQDKGWPDPTLEIVDQSWSIEKLLGR
jgi:hypothetical protein